MVPEVLLLGKAGLCLTRLIYGYDPVQHATSGFAMQLPVMPNWSEKWSQESRSIKKVQKIPIKIVEVPLLGFCVWVCVVDISSLEIDKWKLRFVHVILFGPKFVPSDELLIALTFLKLSAHLATSSNYISQFILCYYLDQLQNNTALRFILNIQLVWPMRLDIMIVGTMYKAMKCAQAQASTSLHAGWLDP